MKGPGDIQSVNDFRNGTLDRRCFKIKTDDMDVHKIFNATFVSSSSEQLEIFENTMGTAHPLAYNSTRETSGVLSKLTTRQGEIIMSIAAGKSRKIIARELSLSENTVKSHAQTAYRVLGINSRSSIRALLGTIP